MVSAHSATLGRIRDLISLKLPPLDRFRLEKVQDRLVEAPRCGILSSIFCDSLLPYYHSLCLILMISLILFFLECLRVREIGYWVIKRFLYFWDRIGRNIKEFPFILDTLRLGYLYCSPIEIL